MPNNLKLFKRIYIMSADPVTGEIQLVSYNFAPRNYASCAGALMSISDNTALFSLIGTIYGGDGRTSYGLPDLRGRAPIHNGGGAGLNSYTIGQRLGSEEHTLQEMELPTVNPTANFTSTGSQMATATATATTRTSSAGSKAELIATTEDGTSAKPLQGAFLANAIPGRAAADEAELIYRSTATDDSKKVKLSDIDLDVKVGVDVDVDVNIALTPGDYQGHVTLSPFGGNRAHSIMQPILVMNYCIALLGVYPSRS